MGCDSRQRVDRGRFINCCLPLVATEVLFWRPEDFGNQGRPAINGDRRVPDSGNELQIRYGRATQNGKPTRLPPAALGGYESE